MKPLRYWFFSIASDLVILYLFYLWQAEGIEQAGAVVTFWLWFLTVIQMLTGSLFDKEFFADNPRPPYFITYHVITEVAVISALVWFGYTWLPALLLFGTISVEGARSREPKAEGGAM